MSESLVIVGNGMAAARLVDELAKVALGRFAVPLRDWGNPLGLRGRTRGRWTTGRYVAAAELAAVLLLFVPAASLLPIRRNEQR